MAAATRPFWPPPMTTTSGSAYKQAHNRLLGATRRQSRDECPSELLQLDDDVAVASLANVGQIVPLAIANVVEADCPALVLHNVDRAVAIVPPISTGLDRHDRVIQAMRVHTCA